MPTDELSILRLLACAEVDIEGRMPWSSNATFLVEVALEKATALAVYKPERGERPLWDFPSGLFRREIAAYHLSEALGHLYHEPDTRQYGFRDVVRADEPDETITDLDLVDEKWIPSTEYLARRANAS